MRRLLSCTLAILTAGLGLLAAAPALASPLSLNKAIWGPVEVNGASQFPIYSDLGVGIYETAIDWNTIATRKPADARDPADPAYTWPAEIDEAVAEGQKYGIKVLVGVSGTPSWANGGHGPRFAP